MVWKVKIEALAEKELGRLDPPVAERILNYMYGYLANLKNPRSVGEPLRSESNVFWRYRVGDYRIITSIEDEGLILLVIRAGQM